MVSEDLLALFPREGSCYPKNTFLAPTLLRACCACGLVQDEGGATPGLERWINQRTYCEAHGVSPSELVLTHTYCPTCLAKVQKAMRQLFHKPESEP